PTRRGGRTGRTRTRRRTEGGQQPRGQADGGEPSVEFDGQALQLLLGHGDRPLLCFEARDQFGLYPLRVDVLDTSGAEPGERLIAKDLERARQHRGRALDIELLRRGDRARDRRVSV